jgi:hypothetical protein
VDARLVAAEAKPDTGRTDIVPLDLDADGNCRINIFNDVPQFEISQYPYSRCYMVQSVNSVGQVMATSGFALSSTPVLTSNVHVTNISQKPGVITVMRLYQTVSEDGDTSDVFESSFAKSSTYFGGAANQNIGLN